MLRRPPRAVTCHVVRFAQLVVHPYFMQGAFCCYGEQNRRRLIFFSLLLICVSLGVLTIVRPGHYPCDNTLQVTEDVKSTGSINSSLVLRPDHVPACRAAFTLNNKGKRRPICAWCGLLSMRQSSCSSIKMVL